MSISETLDPVPPSSHLNEPSFEPLSELGDAEGAGQKVHAVAPDLSGHFTPPNGPTNDLVSELGSVDLSDKLEDKRSSAPSDHFDSSNPSNGGQGPIKTEQGILTPQYGTDIASIGHNGISGGNVSSSQVYHLQSGAGADARLPSSGKYTSSAGSQGAGEVSGENDAQAFRPPFVVNLEMVKQTMEGVNRLLGVDLSDTEVSESALLDDPTKDGLGDETKPNMGMEQKDQVVVPKGEYSHMRLICDACGHIVAAVGRAVIEAARESFEEGLQQGTPGMRPKPPVRKKRGGILGFKELAARANLSPWHFHRVFRVTTGVTPKTYGEALWEYLMLESGFNLDNEELTIDRNLNGKPGASLSQGISPASSSSPQSPTVAAAQYSPNSSSRSPPISAAVMGTSGAPQSATHSQALAQNVVPGTGRVRKARSRSRPSRSRSRTRSQTQSQVLTTLSAIGDAAAVDPGPRGRSFSRGVPSPVAGSMPQNMLSNTGVSGSQGHPAPMPPPVGPQQIAPDAVGSTPFDTDWFGPPEDLLSGLGGHPGGAQSHNMNMPQMPNQDLDAPDLTALSLQQLGLDQPASASGDMGDMRQRADVSNWQMPTTMNPMGSPSALASSAPDVSLLGSGYGNPAARLERFKSPESIANGERNQHMNNSFAMSNFQAPTQGLYNDNSGMTGYVGSLNMNSFHRDGDYSLPRAGMHMQQQQQHAGMNQGSVGYPSNTLSPSGVNSFSEGVSPSAGSNTLDSQMHSNSNAPSMHNMSESMHENLQPSYRGSMHESLQENFQENLQREMYQQQQQHQQGDGLGGLGDLPTSYYLGPKDSSKYDGDSKQEDDDFVSALLGDDPPMLSSWNEADENQIQDYGF